MKINPFNAGVLPVELTAEALTQANNKSTPLLLSLILANLSVSAGHALVMVEGVVPVCDTAIYAAGDTLFDRTAIPGAVRAAGFSSVLKSLTILDKDDQTAAQIDLFFLSANVAFGTLNAAPSISDAVMPRLRMVPARLANVVSRCPCGISSPSTNGGRSEGRSSASSRSSHVGA